MGCWEETDALTLLPIYEKDPCVLVVMDKLFTDGFHRGGEYNPYENFRDPAIFNRIEAIYHGTYNDYGWIKEVEDTEEPVGQEGAKSGTKVFVDRPRSQRRVTIFFHKKVWEEAVVAGMDEAREWEQRRIQEFKAMDKIQRKTCEDFGWEYRPMYGYEAPPSLEAVQLKAVSEVAYWTRRDLLICEKFHGAQSSENHYYDVVHRLTDEMWKQRKEKESQGW